MWILDAEGDALKGNRYWLRPGQEYNLGRGLESRIALTAFKTVSKTHITITVGAVSPGSAANVNSRPSLTITDHDSRFGTWLNGTDVKGKTTNVTSVVNTLKLAKMPENLRIRWEPIVFTNAGSRATKIKQLTEKMEPFGIKFVKDYTEETTYVMGPKLNTAKGLAALIHQKRIVTDLFADALNSALSQIGDVLDPDSLPDPTEFRPATDEYPPESIDPNPARGEIFKDILFIFLDENQYDNLISPISAGLGKAVVFDPTGKGLDDLVEFAKSKGQVVLVRRSLDSEEDALCIEAARRLGYEAITQSNLMWPVITVNRASLFKPVEAISQPQSSQTARQTTPEPSPTIEMTVTEVPDSVDRPATQPLPTKETLEAPSKPIIKKLKSINRSAVNTQADLFDEFFKTSPNQSSIKVSPRKSRNTTNTGDLFPEFSSPTKPPKPVAPIQEEEEEEEENYAPTAKEMMKRLAENPESAPHQVDSDDEPFETEQTTPTKGGRGKKRPAPEDDEVIVAAKERKRIALEEKQRAAEELAAAVKDHEHLKNLGVVETFSVDLTSKPPSRGTWSERWDPAWNGRNNFKKFRRADKTVSLGIGRQMIKLVDYKGKSAVSQEFFFVEPEWRSGSSKVEDSISTDLTLTPVKSAGTKKSGSQRSRSSKGSGRHLFVQDEDSDNDLGF